MTSNHRSDVRHLAGNWQDNNAKGSTNNAFDSSNEIAEYVGFNLFQAHFRTTLETHQFCQQGKTTVCIYQCIKNVVCKLIFHNCIMSGDP